MNEERVGFEAWLGITPKGAAHDLAYEAFRAGAAWQRAQGAVPEKKVESVRWGYRSLGYAEGWNACVDALLAAAPARPAERQEQGEVQRLREALDHIIGLSRALRVGGPDPMDLEGLSNALEEAVDTAHAAIAASTGQEAADHEQ